MSKYTTVDMDYELIFFINGKESSVSRDIEKDWIDDNNIISLPNDYQIKIDRSGDLVYITYNESVILPDNENVVEMQNLFSFRKAIVLPAYCVKDTNVKIYYYTDCYNKIEVLFHSEPNNNIVFINIEHCRYRPETKHTEIITLGGASTFGNPYLHFVNAGYGDDFENAMLEECYDWLKEMIWEERNQAVDRYCLGEKQE